MEPKLAEPARAARLLGGPGIRVAGPDPPRPVIMCPAGT